MSRAKIGRVEAIASGPVARQALGRLVVDTPGQGLFEITAEAARFVLESRLRDGLLTLFCRHTSASLTIQENADPTCAPTS